MENEDIQLLIESEKYAPLSASESAAMKLMLENTQKEYDRLVTEGTLSGDIAQFTPILMPMVRRLYPTLIANEILGFQPMTMPTGYIYALVNQYSGTQDNKVSPLQSSNALTSKIFDYTFTANTSGLDADDLVPGTTITGNDSGAIGVVKYNNGSKILVQVTSGTFTLDDTACTTDLTGDETVAIDAIYSNEAAFKTILKNYTGPVATAVAEALGTDMKEIGFSIAKKSIEAQSRALKGQYTVEMYQDLKSQHGLLADEEIMSLMSYEMQAEIDREVVDFVNSNATQLSDSSFPALDTADNATIAAGYGRWEIERYRREAIRISKESAQIGIDTKRGQGNIILCSPKIVTMLEQVGGFKAAEQIVNVKQPVSGGIAGTYDNKYKVVVDQYASSDYITVLYKGADRRDAMGFFAPYVPMSFTKVTHQDTGQPAVIAKTRYALSTIPGVESATSTDRAATYARSYAVPFTNTILAD